MFDKKIEAINHIRNKNKQRSTKEKIFNHITKTNKSIDQCQLMEASKSMKANGVIMTSFSISPKENENLTFLLIRIKIHGSLVINHQ